MKLHRSFALCALCLLTAACNNRPVYFGHETSTEGMPGVVGGQKVTPNVKLGKPYMVSGHIYVPRYDPNYVEEGMASWYGPGFHGGKTANGESFNKYDYTAAHPTLPMPSIVRVTNLKNGKQVYVRINDRGPYAAGRIIDLSRSAAEQIDLVRMGVAKVRVEYMPLETQRFVELISHGREPSSIDIATEVIGHTNPQYAVDKIPEDRSKWWEYASPVTTANAAETGGGGTITTVVPANSEQAVVIAPPADNDNSVTVTDVPPPGPTVIVPAAPPAVSPFAAMPASAQAEPPIVVNEVSPDAPAPSRSMITMPPAQPNAAPAVMIQPAAPPAGPGPTIASPPPGYYVQLGSFSVESNAISLQSRFTGMTSITQGQGANGTTLYRVRMGPYNTPQEAETAMNRARQMGAAEAKIIKP